MCCGADRGWSTSMVAEDDLRGEIGNLKREVKQTMRKAREKARERGTAADIRVAGRSNVVIARNVGRSGSVRGVSAEQRAPIRQGRLRTSKRSEAERTPFEGGQVAE